MFTINIYSIKIKVGDIVALKRHFTPSWASAKFIPRVGNKFVVVKVLSNQNIQIAKDLAKEPVTVHVSNIKKVPHPMAPDVPTLPKESDKKKKVAKQAQLETQDTDLNGDSQNDLVDISVPDMEIPS